MSAPSPHPFETLTPDFIFDALESQGYILDGRNFALNSYENRVYQIGIEDQLPIIGKFYRPERWSAAQIQEEHDFCFELSDQELPIVTPLLDAQGRSIREFGGFMFALYPRQGGHAPEFDNLDQLSSLGTCLGRMHMVAQAKSFEHRPSIDLQSFVLDSVELIEQHFIPMELKTAYSSLIADILPILRDRWQSIDASDFIRCHGDCHAGNILWRDEQPHFVDFDDARMAPAMQDMWMMLSGDRQRQQLQLMELYESYSEFADFPVRQIPLIETFRTFRIIHYSAWLARRWQDPAFPMHFPWFNTMRYWSDHILELREQFSALQEPPLQLFN